MDLQALIKTLRLMRLTAILLLAATLQVSARTEAQTVTFTARSVTLEKVFAEIKIQTGFFFFYDNADLAAAKPVSVDLKNTPLPTALETILAGQPLNYTIQGNTIFITKKTDLPAPPTPPPGDVHGRVTDSLGIPLFGATVAVKGSRQGAQTDKDGYFDLKGLNNNATLLVSFTGFSSREIKLNGKNLLEITLLHSISPLDAIQVIPYGTVTKRLNTGNVSTVTSKEIEEQPVTSVLEALEGRVPGLVITQNTGIPGGSFKVLIRGQNSILNGTDPYYVIDGVPYNSQLPASPVNTLLMGGSPLNYLNPFDIESIEVLKDAEATAIYGSKAANGAILITTKKGKAGLMHYDVNFSTGITTAARTIQVLNTPQYLAMRHEAFYNDSMANPLAGITPGPGDHDINGDWDSTRNVNWAKILTNKPAQYTDAEASVSGGTPNVQYMIGVGYNIQKTGFPSLLPGDGGNKRASLHFNINTISPNKKLKLALTGGYSATKNTVQSEDFTADRLTLAPDAPLIFNPDGGLNWAPLAPGQTGTWSNPYAPRYVKYVGNYSNLTSNINFSYALLKNLEISTNFGYGFNYSTESQLVPTTTYDPAERVTSGHSNFGSSNGNTWIIEPQANYKLHVGASKFSALIGATFQGSNSSATNQSANGFISDALLNNLAAANSVYTSSGSSQNKYEAVFGRLNFNWADKYLLDLNARRDGTTRFGPGKQFGNFGDVGAGWIFTKEDFFPKNLGFLSFGKLRGSYGLTGSDQIGDYQYISLYGLSGSLPYQGSQGLAPRSLFNPDLAWESTRKLEGGIELGFLKDRITIQASYYRDRTGNQLVNTPVSTVTGFNQVASNLPALVQNSGKEFQLNAIFIRTKDFTWSGSFNIGINRNKLVSFPGLETSPYQNTLFVGKSLSTNPVYHYMGVNDSSGLYQVATTTKGVNTSTLGTGGDHSYLVDRSQGAFAGGFGNNLSYKGFSLNLFFQITKQTGQKLWFAYGQIPGTMFNQPTEVLNRWQNPGDKKPFEKFTQDYGSPAATAYFLAQNSDFAFGDASYMRLKTVALSWQMPETMARKAGLRSLGISINAQNLLTFTNYDGADPESLNASTGPRRTASGGVQIGL